MAEQQQESRLTVVLALAANLGIALAKTVAAVITGSASMASEAGHSFADTTNEVLLLTALHRSARPPDRRHPFGHGTERYIWSFLVAVCIFGMGALFAFVQGVQALMGEEAGEKDPLVGYVVLAVSAVLEAISWRQAYRQTRESARENGQPLRAFLRTTDDPTTKSVLFEDSAALIGLALAAAGLGLHQITGSAVWDGVASLLIGIVLTVAAFLLGRTNLDLLIGRQARPAILNGVERLVLDAPEIEALVDLLTMTVGTGQVLVCVRLDFRDDLGAADVERTCVRLGEELRAAYPDVYEVFLEPVPRDDPDLRERVIARYGCPPYHWAAGER
ncbi:cation diffusion facilitator family transporter [Actinoallomurus purpureus]|uniref:cation diffusion facilitator family transporter n=1 Tax=Actinoallomurus purpureus TaxID=478114 RepID=UPI0020926A6B|nr:cation diffusion facilitator family transporter [Actinoallomurus purpureus]MCO6011180.1 cation diffusion facilitator family transporter [Actinoallomurus purpureus]